MGDWSYLSSLLDKVQTHSTPIGKIWMVVLFIFRILVLGVAADSVWGDEQSEFYCNQNEPGCENACYDWRFPISHVRFWVLQILFVSTPTLVYLGHVGHVIHQEEKLKEKIQNQNHPGLRRPKYTDSRGRTQIRGVLLRSYLTQIFVKIGLEVAFIAGQYYIYGFIMTPYFTCSQEPCPGRGGVECYMSRPTEKTIFILFMLVVACVSVLLNIAEVFYLICSYVRRGSRKESDLVHRMNSAVPAGGPPVWQRAVEMSPLQSPGSRYPEEEKGKHT